MKKEIEITARAVIQTRDKFLVCWHKEKRYYFYPGGHIKFGEAAKETLEREIEEEIGTKIKNCSFIGAVENIYLENGQSHHEIILAFDVKLDKLKIKSKENHIEFYLKTKEELVKDKVFPIVLTKAILKWLRNKKLFWASQIYGKTME